MSFLLKCKVTKGCFSGERTCSFYGADGKLLQSGWVPVGFVQLSNGTPAADVPVFEEYDGLVTPTYLERLPDGSGAVGFWNGQDCDRIGLTAADFAAVVVETP